MAFATLRAAAQQSRDSSPEGSRQPSTCYDEEKEGYVVPQRQTKSDMHPVSHSPQSPQHRYRSHPVAPHSRPVLALKTFTPLEPPATPPADISWMLRAQEQIALTAYRTPKAASALIMEGTPGVENKSIEYQRLYVHLHLFTHLQGKTEKVFESFIQRFPEDPLIRKIFANFLLNSTPPSIAHHLLQHPHLSGLRKLEWFCEVMPHTSSRLPQQPSPALSHCAELFREPTTFVFHWALQAEDALTRVHHISPPLHTRTIRPSHAHTRQNLPQLIQEFDTSPFLKDQPVEIQRLALRLKLHALKICHQDPRQHTTELQAILSQHPTDPLAEYYVLSTKHPDEALPVLRARWRQFQLQSHIPWLQWMENAARILWPANAPD